ncbi:MAG: class I SAM-dependent methyltransferase [Bryobacteraceae bacterium]
MLTWRAEHREFLEGFGAQIGKRLGGLIPTIEVTADAAQLVYASKLNILTERIAANPAFDLAVATNIFVYFTDQELLLAMQNIRSMLRPGGYFLHNDARGVVEPYGRALEMPVVHARMVSLSRTTFDAVVIHRVQH